MSSHRNPGTNFSSLKKLLPPLPISNSQQQDKAEGKSELKSATNQVPSLEAISTSLEPSAVKNTAAVQQQDIHSAGLQTTQSNLPRSALTARPGKSRPITRPSTFRLPIELQNALKEVADYNQLNMTDIVAEGIWLHLQNFKWPPNSDELRSKLSSLY